MNTGCSLALLRYLGNVCKSRFLLDIFIN